MYLYIYIYDFTGVNHRKSSKIIHQWI